MQLTHIKDLNLVINFHYP